MHEPLTEEQLRAKTGKELKQILKQRRVDYSVCVEKNDMINLIIKTQPQIKPLKQLEPQVECQPISETTMDSGNNFLAEKISDLQLTENENQNIKDCLLYLQQEPKIAAHWYNLGVHLAAERRMEASHKCYLSAIQFEPSFTLAHNNLAGYYKDHGDTDRAIEHYKKALEADPNFCIALNNLAVTYHGLGKLGAARVYCERALALEPNSAETYNNLGALLLQAGCAAEEAVKCFIKCCDLDPVQSAGRFGAYSNQLLSASSMAAPCEDELTGNEEDIYNNTIFRWHKEWAIPFERRYDDVRFCKWYNNLDPNRAIRVGYLSTDFRGHPVSYFAEAPLKFMDERKVEIWVYFNGPPGDKRTEVIRTKIPDQRWRMLGARTPLQCAHMIRQDKIDILVELGGHAAGNRLDIMVLKPAPIQVTWIGYANTTGLSVIDYRITDGIADPVTTHQGFSEVLVRMPDPCAFLCYTGSYESEECTGAAALKNGYVTFGSFNALHKLTDQCFELWCRILHAVPKSHLFLKCKPFAGEMIKNRYITRFKNNGISEDRIRLETHVPSRKDHLDLYKLVDIGIDPFPYAGTTTSAEALWMGCPFITLNRVKFPIHAQNVGTTFLSRIPGLKKFIAKNKQEYLDIAVYFANHLEELDEIKKNLRNRMMNSPICNGPLFCEKLTGVYREMWLKYCQQCSA